MSRPQDRIDPPDPAPGTPGQPAWPTPPEPGIVPTPRAVFDPARPVPERPVWLLIGGALVCLAVAGAGLTWWQTAARQRVVTRGQFDGVQALEMRDLGSNAVVVRGSDRSDVSVTRRLTWVGGFGDQPPASEQFSGATLLVDNPCVGRMEVGVDAAAVRVTTTSGDARLRLPTDAAYDVRTDTRSGHRSVTAAHDPSAGRTVTVTTTSGDITIG